MNKINLLVLVIGKNALVAVQYVRNAIEDFAINYFIPYDLLHKIYQPISWFNN